jgi:hypothetical protein
MLTTDMFPNQSTHDTHHALQACGAPHMTMGQGPACDCHDTDRLAAWLWWLGCVQVKGTLPLQEIQLACSCMRLLEAHLDEFK